MHSRAYLLLKRDLVNLQRFPLEGVSAGPCSDLNILQWQARLQGLPNTTWEGGVFHLHLQFSAEFNSTAPRVQFMTIPFHPNIDPTDGTPHCHLLSTGWTEAISVPVLLISLQALLSNPELESRYIVNVAASQLLHKAPHAYRQMVLDCVSASLRVDVGLAPYEGDDINSTAISPAPSPLPPYLPPLQQPQSVSYDDYFKLWKDIATSIPPAPQQDGSGKGAGSPIRRFRAQERNLPHKLHQHHLLQLGQGGQQLKQSVTRQHRIEQLRQTYIIERDEEEKEGDIDQLLQWTKDLDTAVLTTPKPTSTPL